MMAGVQRGTLSRSPPPCGQGLVVGVRIGSLCWGPPSLTLPHKGGENGESFARDDGGGAHA